MEPFEITKALEELRTGKKRKFIQTVDLVVNLKNFDVRKEALNTFVTIPHPRKKKIAAFLPKHSSSIDTITEEDFVKYKETKDIKKLAKQYDAFIAVAPLMGKIATKFGRVFGPVGKMPSPQAGIIPKFSEEALVAMKDKVQKVIRVRNKEMSIKLPIGKEDMADKDLEENILDVLLGLEKKLPRGRDNIKQVLIKFTMTKPVVVKY
jgi:large subunit ribosomal protein L1